MRRFYPLILITITTLLQGCPSRVPPSGPGVSTIDAETVATAVGLSFQGVGGYMVATATTWDKCVAGVSLLAASDGILFTGIPIGSAVEAGECQGETTGWTIDPTPCQGLPGEPTDVYGVRTAKTEVTAILAGVLPAASNGLDFWATQQREAGNVAACELLSTIADYLAPGGGMVISTLTVIETPGEPYQVAGWQWDCSDCRTELLDGPGATPAIP